jgi:hypothetical protein
MFASPQQRAEGWGSLTNVAAGHALASFTHMTRPVMVSVDPTPCKLLMVE